MSTPITTRGSFSRLQSISRSGSRGARDRTAGSAWRSWPTGRYGELDLDRIGPPTGSWLDYVAGSAREMAAAGLATSGFDGVLVSTIPIASGLSSSAALELATAWALSGPDGPAADPLEVARICQRAENAYVGVQCGLMDQFASAGGIARTASALARPDFEAALALVPDHPDALLGRALTLVGLGEAQAALADIERAMDVAAPLAGPDARRLLASCYDLRGGIRHGQGREDLAKADRQRATDLRSANRTAAESSYAEGVRLWGRPPQGRDHKLTEAILADRTYADAWYRGASRGGGTSTALDSARSTSRGRSSSTGATGGCPNLVADVQDAMDGARRDVIDVIRSIGSLGKHVHFHLHDGHPLIPGLSDHFTFLRRLPIPFSYQGRQSLSMMYGPGGLESVIWAATEACRPGGASFTLEIHQVEGRLPLADASGLFAHWRDLTNAERMNYWLSVLGENAILVYPSASPRASRPLRLTVRMRGCGRCGSTGPWPGIGGSGLVWPCPRP